MGAATLAWMKAPALGAKGIPVHYGQSLKQGGNGRRLDAVKYGAAYPGWQTQDGLPRILPFLDNPIAVTVDETTLRFVTLVPEKAPAKGDP